VIVDVGIPFAQSDVPREHLERGCLARPVDTQETEALTLGHPDTQAVNRCQLLLPTPLRENLQQDYEIRYMYETFI